MKGGLYYDSHFENIKNDLKKTWRSINNILHRKKYSNSYPDHFNVEGKLINDPLTIANAFNSFFTNIGENLASKITYTGPENHLSSLTDTINSSFEFQAISETDTSQIIKQLKITSSYGLITYPPNF